MLVNEDVNLNINAQSMHVKIDRTLLGETINHPNNNIYAISIGSGSNVNIDLNNGDFELEAIDKRIYYNEPLSDGIKISTQKGKDTNFSLNAKNIKLTKKSELWTDGTAINISGDNDGDKDVNSKSGFKFHAKEEFSIDRFMSGLAVTNNDKIDIEAPIIRISAIQHGAIFTDNADIRLGNFEDTESIDIIADTAFHGYVKGSVSMAAQNVNLIGAGRDFDQNDDEFILLNGEMNLTIKANNINILPMEGVQNDRYGDTEVYLNGGSSLKLDANTITMWNDYTKVDYNSNYEVVAKTIDIISKGKIEVNEFNYSLKAETINVTYNEDWIPRLWSCGGTYNDEMSSIYLEADKLTVNADDEKIFL